jgi:MarR family transcriptional regulator, organic hydroperoxide resistance regulator
MMSVYILSVATSHPQPDVPRRDLAAMVMSLGKELVAAELPILQANQISMWEYTVLCALANGPSPSQSALAQTVGADKTRLIPILDALQERGLITRSAHIEDRRLHVLEATVRGKRLQAKVQQQIQRNEIKFLERLGEADRGRFIEAITVLSLPSNVSVDQQQ